MPDYSNYYGRTIDFNISGFKLVLGGTGLGKTRGIRQIIKQHLETNSEKKFVYVANRIQLLNEMQRDLLEEGLNDDSIIQLERNLKTVKNVLSEGNHDKFYELLEHKNVTSIASKFNLDLNTVRLECKEIEILIRRLHIEGEYLPITTILERTIETNARYVKNFFRQIIVYSDQNKSWLLNHPIVQTLFPFIAFTQNHHAKVLLLTIQKGYLGFFDGEKNINLMQLTDHIIFLDEFDFLESDLIDLICSSPQIEDPFLFVEMFYRTMKRHKLPFEQYPYYPQATSQMGEFRTRTQFIVEEIEKRTLQKGINFPAINQFTTQIDERHAAIFQTNRMILREPLYLCETSRSFEIVKEEIEGTTVPALDLFNTVQWATNQILFLFNDIASFSPTVYNEMLGQCFPQSYLANQVQTVSQFPKSYKEQYTRFGNLLSAGFGLYEVQDLQQVTDEDEVKFQHYAIHTTPERIILSMAQNNLVFGLSATADITRLVEHFNIPWLKQELGQHNSARYFEIEETDEEIIREQNYQKQTQRGNTIDFSFTPLLEEYEGGIDFAEYILQIAEHFPEFGGNDQSGYRRKRVENFFATLLGILETQENSNLENQTHLIFLNSFKQIKFILENPNCHEGTDLFDVKTAPLGDNKHFSAYEIQLDRQVFNIVFYDAKYAREVHDSEEIKSAYYDLFWQNKPVIVVTQYASAGNSVNLQYYATQQAREQHRETDFRNVHLLDTPYFFFEKIDPSEQTNQEIVSALKKNLWYHAKLFEAKVISAGRFFNLIENLRNYDFNREYNFSRNQALNADALKNRMAMYIQALGRIERVWNQIPTQTVWMTREVFVDFSVYYTDSRFEEQRAIRDPRISNNLKQLKQIIENETDQVLRQARQAVDESLIHRNHESKERIQRLLARIARMRQGKTDEEETAEIRTIWNNLRRVALRHDFANDLIDKYKAAFNSSYYQNGSLYIDPEYNLYPANSRPNDVIRWRLNSIYDVIKNNQIIARSFLNTTNSYELEFSPATESFFTPYFYQAILVGAIGEAAIEALLKHYGVLLEQEVTDQLFEIADLKFKGRPWYIDCKNYSERTLSHFALDIDDPAYHPSLSEGTFEAKALSKLDKIRDFHSSETYNCKLIYLNLVSSDNRLKRYIHSDDFTRDVSFDKADIIIVQGILNIDDPNELTLSFEQFLEDIR